MIYRIHKLHWFLLMLIEQSNNLGQMDIQVSGLKPSRIYLVRRPDQGSKSNALRDYIIIER